MSKSLRFTFVVLPLLAGCAGLGEVVVSDAGTASPPARTRPSGECENKGTIIGETRGGSTTSSRRAHARAVDDARNKAAVAGANYLQTTAPQLTQSQHGPVGATVMGTGFYCKPGRYERRRRRTAAPAATPARRRGSGADGERGAVAGFSRSRSSAATCRRRTRTGRARPGRGATCSRNVWRPFLQLAERHLLGAPDAVVRHHAERRHAHAVDEHGHVGSTVGRRALARPLRRQPRLQHRHRRLPEREHVVEPAVAGAVRMRVAAVAPRPEALPVARWRTRSAGSPRCRRRRADTASAPR